MRAPRALLVDLDGTLVDTRAANHAAYAAALAEQGIAFDRAQWDRLAEGRNWRQFLPALLQGRRIDAASIAGRKAELYPQMLSASTLNRALAAMLRGARSTCATALVTTASAANATAVLRHHRLERLFDLVVTGNDVANHKPAPDAYILAAERLGVAPDECLVFEDSEIGAAAAAAFGAPCLHVAFPAPVGS